MDSMGFRGPLSSVLAALGTLHSLRAFGPLNPLESASDYYEDCIQESKRCKVCVFRGNFVYLL